MNISERTIFIPGATSGIGLALAERLQAAGATVIIGGRRTALLDELRATHGFDTIPIDVADAESVASAASELIARHPDLDTVIAMAGIMIAEDWHSPASFLDTAERIVETNVLGPIRLIAGFVEHLQTRADAAIITVSSGLASVPLRPTPTYNASKAFVHMLSESIRLQLADTSVRVVELVPPPVQTDLMPGQRQNPMAMPLAAYADETLALLAADEAPREILVERVKFLRFAEVRGDYDEVARTVNGMDIHAA